MAVTHAKVSAKADGADTSEVLASDWNDDHVVALAAGDISADSTTLVGTGVTVQAVLEELDNGVADHLADTSAAHAATAISASSTNLVGVGTTVQAVLEELDDGIADHLSDTSGAHAASAISADSTTLVGTGTDVQAVLEELDNSIATGLLPQVYHVIFAKQGTVAVTTEASPVLHWTNDTGRTLTFTKIRARAEVGPNGATQDIDINMDGTTIFTSTKVVLPDSTGGVSTVLTTTGFAVTTIADGHLLSMNVDATLATGLANLLVTVWMTG